MIAPILAAVVLVIPQQGSPSQALGQTSSPALTYDGSTGKLDVATPQLEDPSLDIDGLLDEEVWSRAAVLSGFTQYDPVEGAPASERTEALVFLTEDAIYFGVRAYEEFPGEIRATLAERDEFTRNDDYVRVVLDTFDDQRRAYTFTVNPYGVQHDALWLEGGGGGGGFRRGGGGGGGGGGGRRFGPPLDNNPNFIWESGGQITDFGWSAEFKIPFKSVRFPEVPLQEWGINVFRRIQRNGYQQSWAPVSGNVANQLTQAGHLTQLRDLDPGLFLEINPVITGKRLGAYDEDVDLFGHDDPEGEFGMDLTYGLTSNLTLDATINPDFSQVEADAGQIAVNERFALFFPEKRPFFLEGTEIFQLPAQLIFTRAIVNPAAGAKLTGKIGNLNLGYLGAVDDRTNADNAVFNLLRVRQDIGASSTLGAVYTDRTVGSNDFNRVGGADARLVLGGRYTISALAAASWTNEFDGEGVEDTPSHTGSFFSTNVSRTGREFSWNASIQDIDPNFEAKSGFLRRTGITNVSASTTVTRYGEAGSLIENWGQSLNLFGFWDHDTFWDGGGFEEGTVSLSSSLSFKNNISLWVTGSVSKFEFPAADYEGLFVAGDGGSSPFLPDQGLFSSLLGFNGFFFVSNWQKVRGNAGFDIKEVPIYGRGVPVEVGKSWGGNLSLNLFPTPSLQGEIGIRHSTINRSSDGTLYSSATIPRVKVQYQFSRSLFFRTILEYSAQERRDLLDPETGQPLEFCSGGDCQLLESSDVNDVHFEGLLSFEPSPGTVFFIGYSRDFEDTDAFRFHNVQSQADGLFVKMSYRFRM